ncbi:MAG: vitamin K epoxide reductase family protein [Ferruginibacter sp.]
MPPVITILKNFFRLKHKPPPGGCIRYAFYNFPGTDTLDCIGYFLSLSGTRSMPFTGTGKELNEAAFPVFIECTDDRGQPAYFHSQGQALWQVYPQCREEKKGLAAIPDGNWNMLAYDEAADVTAVALPPAFRQAQMNKTILRSTAIILLTAGFFGALLHLHTQPVFVLLTWLGALVNLFLSLVLYFREQRFFEDFTRPFCGKNNYLGCSRLMQSAFSDILPGFSWASMGIIFYGALLAIPLMAPVRAGAALMGCWLIAAVLVSVALVFTMMRIRVFCKLCLFIHAVNLLMLAVYVWRSAGWQQWSYFTPAFMLNGLLALALAAFFYLVMKAFLQLSAGSREKLAASRILRPALLNSDLSADPDPHLAALFQAKTPLTVTGANEAGIEVSLLVSMECRHCAELMEEACATLFYKDVCRVQLYFLCEEDDWQGQVFLNQLAQEATGDPGKLFAAVRQWYRHRRYPGKQAAVSRPATAPSFCLRTDEVVFATIPAVFFDGRRINAGFTPADFPGLVFLANRRRQQ